jgi:hypothetical protein
MNHDDRPEGRPRMGLSQPERKGQDTTLPEVYDNTLVGAARFARETLAALIDDSGPWPNKAKTTYTAWKKLDAALAVSREVGE